MRKISKIFLMILLFTGIIGCSQKEQVLPKEEKENIEPATAQAEEDNKDEILDNIAGIWINEEGMITLSTNNETILIEAEVFSTSIISELELEEIKNNELTALLTKVNGESDDSGVEYKLRMNDSNNLIMSITADQQSREFPPFTKFNEPDDAMLVKMVGNWANAEAYIRISKVNNTLIMGLRDENEGIDWKNVIEVTGVADNTILGTIVESGGDAKDLGRKLTFNLKDPNELIIKTGSEKIELKKTDMERDTWQAEREEWSEEYGFFVDTVNEFLEYEDVWNADTGEKEVGFYAYSNNRDFVIASSEIGKSNDDSEDLAVLVENYSTEKFEGTVWKAPESKKHWIDKTIIIEKINEETLVISIDDEKIIVSKS